MECRRHTMTAIADTATIAITHNTHLKYLRTLVFFFVMNTERQCLNQPITRLAVDHIIHPRPINDHRLERLIAVTPVSAAIHSSGRLITRPILDTIKSVVCSCVSITAN